MEDPPNISLRCKTVLCSARRYAICLDRLITVPIVSFSIKRKRLCKIKHPVGLGVLPDAAPLAGGPVMSVINFVLLYIFFRMAGASSRLASTRLPTLALDGAAS